MASSSVQLYFKDQDGKQFADDLVEDLLESSMSSSLSLSELVTSTTSSSDIMSTTTTSPPSPNIVGVNLDEWNWAYRGEGGANLVIRMENVTSDKKMIARFSKSKYKDKDNDAKVEETAFYAMVVMSRLLGSRFVRPVTVGIMDQCDFETVKFEAQPFRPLERCKKDIRSHKVILSPDCVFLDDNLVVNTIGDTISVEIKPKQGWHSEQLASCSSDLCHRCLKQNAKLNQGEINTISRYCPLDLFSGDLERMKRAIFDLYENPHNRFKVFRNGDLIYTDKKGEPDDMDKTLADFFGVSNLGHHGSGINSLAAMLCTVLLGQNKVADSLLNLVPSKKASSNVNKCDTRANPLPEGCILEILLALQKHTDISDQGAKALLEKLMTTANNTKSLEDLHNLAIWYPLTLTADEADNKTRDLLEHLGHSQDFIRDLQRLQRFLLSVTAKDVSLLVTFRKVLSVDREQELDDQEVRLSTVVLNNVIYRVMISVIDLDPKPVHRIPVWVERNEEWLKIYEQTKQRQQRQSC